MVKGLGEVDQRLIQLSKTRLEKMGEIESGLFNYYITRIGHGSMFNEDDMKMIEYLESTELATNRILEVAAGCGQVSFALEERGFERVEFSEFDSRRLAYGEFLKEKLDSMVIIHGSDYRKLELKDFDVIFVVNAVSSSIGAQDADLLIDVISSGTDIILKFGYYGIDNEIFEVLENSEIIRHDVIFSTNQEFRRYSRKRP